MESTQDTGGAQITPSAQNLDKHRIFYLDNLRTFLTALVICHHLAIAHGASGGWYYKAPPPEGSIAPVLLTFFAVINQSFFMSLFFMVSAFFTPLSYDKKGPGLFLKDRLTRLGIPLLVYFFLLNPSVVYLVFRFEGRIQEGYLDFMIHNLLRVSGTGPLWFVMSLLIFAAAYVALRVALPAREKGEEHVLPLPTNLQILIFLIGIGLITFLVRLRFWVGWNVMNLQIAYFPLYICMYVFGVWACRYSWLDDLKNKQVNLWFGISVGMIAMMPIVMALGGALDGGTKIFEGGASWQAFVYATCEPVLCIGISMKLLMVFRNRCTMENRLTRAMAKSAYTAYIIHPFFVVCGTYLFVGLPLDPLLKFVIISPLVVASCFFISNILRQTPLLRRVL